MSIYTAKEIMETIPHRHPFMLIDTIEELEDGSRAVGKKCVSFNEPYFAGHGSSLNCWVVCTVFRPRVKISQGRFISASRSLMADMAA